MTGFSLAEIMKKEALKRVLLPATSFLSSKNFWNSGSLRRSEWAVLIIVSPYRLLFIISQYVKFMFSASWSYDLYLVLRDGDYPITWFSNIFASSVLYISAGLFWSLDWIQGRDATFAFLEDSWPYSTSEGVFSNIVWFALPFMVLVSFLILYFFWFKAGI